MKYPNCLTFETLGSYWLFNENEKKYCRMPKGEQPREFPEWGDERAGPLQDFVWHEYVKWDWFESFDPFSSQLVTYLRIVPNTAKRRIISAPYLELSSPLKYMERV